MLTAPRPTAATSFYLNLFHSNKTQVHIAGHKVKDFTIGNRDPIVKDSFSPIATSEKKGVKKGKWSLVNKPSFRFTRLHLPENRLERELSSNT